MRYKGRLALFVLIGGFPILASPLAAGWLLLHLVGTASLAQQPGQGISPSAPASAEERPMKKLNHPGYVLPGQRMESGASAKITADQAVAIKAVASWKSTDEKGLQYDTYYYNNVSVRQPYQLLNEGGNPIWVIEAVFTFSDVGWNYGLGEIVTDYCGRRGQVDGSFVAPRANVFQLVPALQERGGQIIIFNNNGCYNPARVRWGIGGRALVIPNDHNSSGAYADNSGSFDVKVTVIERLP